MVIQEAENTVERLKISEDSPLANKPLKEARISEKTGMWVLVVRRDDQWMRPRPNMVLKLGDVIIASGYSEGENNLKQLLSGKSTKQESN